MTKRLEHIIKEITLLEVEELEKVLNELIKRIERKKRIESIIDQYMGLGKGVWETDAQKYVDELRKEEEKNQISNG